jgi:hypothetical protein
MLPFSVGIAHVVAHDEVPADGRTNAQDAAGNEGRATNQSSIAMMCTSLPRLAAMRSDLAGFVRTSMVMRILAESGGRCIVSV